MAQANPFDLLLDQVRQVVREELARARQAPAAPSAEPEQEWVRAEELAKKYNVPKTMFEKAGREGKIQRARPGKHVLFNVADVARFIKSQAAGGNANGSH